MKLTAFVVAILVALGVALLVAAPASGLAAPVAEGCLGARQDKLAEVLKDRSQENLLIGQRIPIEQLKLQLFLRLDKDRSGPAPKFAEPASHALFSDEGAALYIVNLWGTACKPCKEELPLLLKTWRTLAADPALRHGLKLLLIHEEAVVLPEVLSELVRAEPDIGTRVALYADANAGFRDKLDQRPFAAPSLPTTLLVDQGGVIRQAFIGTLFNRDAALVHTVKHLLRRPAGPTRVVPDSPSELAMVRLLDNLRQVSAIVRAIDEKQKTESTLSADERGAVREFWQRVGIEPPKDFQIGDKTRAALQKLLGVPAAAPLPGARPKENG
jgi:hypothetical protein